MVVDIIHSESKIMFCGKKMDRSCLYCNIQEYFEACNLVPSEDKMRLSWTVVWHIVYAQNISKGLKT